MAGVESLTMKCTFLPHPEFQATMMLSRNMAKKQLTAKNSTEEKKPGFLARRLSKEIRLSTILKYPTTE